MLKNLILIAILVSVYSCAADQSLVKETAPQFSDTSSAAIQPPNMPLATKKKDLEPLYGKLISNITTSRSSFNPSNKQNAVLSYKLSKPARVTVNVYDPDSGLIYAHSDPNFKKPGQHSFSWGGKDMDGHTVPDEAYFFTIIAEGKSGKTEIYDPTTFSGGIENDITTADIDPRQYTINYKMPEMGRVMIRLGIQGGALMSQLVDWEPRVKGAITEHWNGKDKDNLVNLFEHPNFKMIIAYYNLPENSVITYGNRELNYREYKRAIATDRPSKSARETAITNRSHHYGLSRTVDYSPQVKIGFSNVSGETENGIPILNDKTIVNVTLDEKDKAFFQNSQFEICFFLDHEFYAEDETGYTPFNWVWDLNQVEPGEHLLTVNVSSFDDQVGVISRKVKVVK